MYVPTDDGIQHRYEELQDRRLCGVGLVLRILSLDILHDGDLQLTRRCVELVLSHFRRHRAMHYPDTCYRSR